MRANGSAGTSRSADQTCRSADLPIAHLRWHEATQPDRLAALTRRLIREPQREPIHVTPTESGYLIVDGAHRARALGMLNRHSVRAHVLKIAPEEAVPGWTHLVSHEAGQRLLAQAQEFPETPGRPVAQVSDPHGTVVLWAAGTGQQALANAFHRVADTYQCEPYLRHSPNEALPAGRTALTWVLPAWGELCALVSRHGPVPAGLTRLGGLIATGCGLPADERQRTA